MRENDPELKFIIFTEFVETQSYINNCLQNLGYKTAIMNGRMSPEERQAAKEFFRNEASFLISTDAGGEGIVTCNFAESLLTTTCLGILCVWSNESDGLTGLGKSMM